MDEIEARQPDKLKSGFFSLRKIPVNIVFRVFLSAAGKAPNHQQELKNHTKSRTSVFANSFLIH